jgi:hypothetical protein
MRGRTKSGAPLEGALAAGGEAVQSALALQALARGAAAPRRAGEGPRVAA